MTVEVRPLGVKCNISCHYCYQNTLRAASDPTKKYSLELIKRAILAKGSSFTLFGGEPLLIQKSDLEDLFLFGFEHFGKNAIQTNGTLVDAEHIALFKKYNVSVGISLDGPGESNSPRWAGSVKRTGAATRAAELAIDALLSAGITPGIITTLHRANASKARLPILLDWFKSLDRIGISFARIHLLEVDSEDVQKSLMLSHEESISALIEINEFEKKELHNLRFDIFREIKLLLLGTDREVSCVWRACDSYTTPAVQGIEGHGQTSNCGRTNKAGVDFVKSDVRGFERYIALFNTPQHYGGCNGCRFFLACKGQCPGTAIDGDWRNRSDQCETWFKLFEIVEHELVEEGRLPLSLDPERENYERCQLSAWIAGANPILEDIIVKAQNKK